MRPTGRGTPPSTCHHRGYTAGCSGACRDVWCRKREDGRHLKLDKAKQWLGALYTMVANRPPQTSHDSAWDALLHMHATAKAALKSSSCSLEKQEEMQEEIKGAICVLEIITANSQSIALTCLQPFLALALCTHMRRWLELTGGPDKIYRFEQCYVLMHYTSSIIHVDHASPQPLQEDADILTRLQVACIYFSELLPEYYKYPGWQAAVRKARAAYKARLARPRTQPEPGIDQEDIQAAEAQCRSAMAKYNAGHYQEALQEFQQVANQRVAELQAFAVTMAGSARRMMGQREEAVKDLERAQQLRSLDVTTLQELGAAKLDNGEYEGALNALDQALELQPNDAFTLSDRGETKRMLGDYVGALQDLDLAISLQPNDDFSFKRRGATKRLTNDTQGALVDLNEANRLKPLDAFTLSNRGAVKRMLGDYVGAVADLDQANQLQPHSPFTLSNRAEAKRMLGSNDGHYLDALQDLNDAEQVAGKDLTVLAYILCNRAAIFLVRGNFDLAKKDLDKVVAMQDGGRSLGQAAAVEKSTHACILSLRGALHLLEGGDCKAALHDLDEALTIQPDSAYTCTMREEVIKKLQASSTLAQLDSMPALQLLQQRVKHKEPLTQGSTRGSSQDFRILAAY